ncbi:hypothetical protein K1719_023513 [Acacia pycnantha]|nr:hypothetical protein K1719_023513 [Acacia pycnantha]
MLHCIDFTLSKLVGSFATTSAGPSSISPSPTGPLSPHSPISFTTPTHEFTTPTISPTPATIPVLTSQPSTTRLSPSSSIRIYFASSRFNDFAGADDYYDLWVYDEFHQPDDSSSFGPSDSSISASNTLLKVFDGQECRLDAKYSRMFRKKRNVPIILVSNRIASMARHPGPFQARFMRFRFFTNLCNIEEARLIATLRGCILRRLGLESLPRKSSELPNFPLSYNSVRINVSPDSIRKSSEAHPLFARTSQGEPVILELHQSVAQDANARYSYLRIKVFPSCFHTGELSFLRFCLIPLASHPNLCDSSPVLTSFPVFLSCRIGGNFSLLRGPSPCFPNYLIWPIRASFPDAEQSWSGEIVLLSSNEFSPSAFPPHFPEEALKPASSFLELTFGPVSYSPNYFSSANWDKGSWAELD